MKSIKLLIAAFFMAVSAASAAPGDTTWIAANNVLLDNYNNFDSTINFPSGGVTYRKIYMVFTMGEYACPAGSQYCHQWDYTIQNFLMTPTGDTLELGRFISPYATGGVPRFPSTWTQRYIFDVSDYYPVLKNQAKVRIHYSGYSGGFTANIKFAFIEGTPERNVTGISRLWNGDYTYGNAADPIDNHVTAVSRTAPAGTQAAEMKVNITGHGSDNTDQCCEFSSHAYHVKVNNTQVDQYTIWRNDCGSNMLYPQGGTWIYDRANWCPGDLVHTNTHKLTGVTAGSAYTTDLDFDAYTNTPVSGNSGYGIYTIQGNVIYYGAYNHTTDASIEDIIAPSNFEGHYRENPSSSRPVIAVRNSGSNTITSMTFSYGVKDSVATQYTWTGSLLPSATTQITLPEVATLTNMSLSGASGLYKFVARIIAVNGAADNDIHNDTLTSSFTVAPLWPTAIVVTMKTNSEGISGLGQSPSENYWKITDMSGNLIASRMNANVSTTYADTVYLYNKGFYKLQVADSGGDGLHWWVYDQNPQIGVTAGSITVKKLGTSTIIPFNGNATSGTYHDDFGNGFVQYFSVAGVPTGIGNVVSSGNAASMEAYPNPARDVVNLSLYGLLQVKGTISIMDATGKVVMSQEAASAQVRLNVSGLSAGVYNIIYTGEGKSKTLQTRVTLTK